MWFGLGDWFLGWSGFLGWGRWWFELVLDVDGDGLGGGVVDDGIIVGVGKFDGLDLFFLFVFLCCVCVVWLWIVFFIVGFLKFVGLVILMKFYFWLVFVMVVYWGYSSMDGCVSVGWVFGFVVLGWRVWWVFYLCRGVLGYIFKGCEMICCFFVL